MTEQPLFDPSLKKRKKRVVAFIEDPLGAEADPTTPAPEIIDNLTLNGDRVDLGPNTAHEQMAQNGKADGEADGESTDKIEVDDLGFGDLKTKKKKKNLDLGDEAPESSEPTATSSTGDAPSGVADDHDFSDMKKKKKPSKTKAALDFQAFEKEINETNTKGRDKDNEEADVIAEMDETELGDDPFAQSAEVTSGFNTGNEPWLKSDRDYTYPELLQRFYASLHVSNPSLLTSSGKRYTIAPPQLFRDGNKKSIFANISDICKRMHRQPEHVIQFLFAEMGTTGSVDGSGRLVIKGRFQQKQIENVLRRYIVEYVTCKTCKSPDTLLTKETRIFFMTCESCGSRRSVNAIKSGFQAQVGKRSKNKPT